ncbi:unnamed protein product [Linum trigynum]|uniref:Uncharacterized protein n=1 Tax=Linum trigynum TaxID=586398 RepID=A0AAV2EL63_9ROSI
MAHLARRPGGKLMEVLVKSVENVKPARVSSSSRGFEHKSRKPHNLCLLDQLTGSFYTSFVFFYPPAAAKHGLASPAATADRLKASLSKTLNPFYPLAGRVRDNLVIDDFQAGVPFSEARVVGQTLSEFLAPPKLDLLGELVPFEPMCLLRIPNHDDRPQLAVQMSTFDCGGTAIGIDFNHKIADGGTITAFLNAWAAANGICYYSYAPGFRLGILCFPSPTVDPAPECKLQLQLILPEPPKDGHKEIRVRRGSHRGAERQSQQQERGEPESHRDPVGAYLGICSACLAE